MEKDAVAWVHGADGEVGRAVALLLAARGARVLVTGANERALGACVGEIAHGGGKGRHVVAGVATDDAVRACVDAAIARFGRVDVAIVAGSKEDAARVERVAGVRTMAVEPEGDGDAIARGVVASLG